MGGADGGCIVLTTSYTRALATCRFAALATPEQEKTRYETVDFGLACALSMINQQLQRCASHVRAARSLPVGGFSGRGWPIPLDLEVLLPASKTRLHARVRGPLGGLGATGPASEIGQLLNRA